MINNLKTIRKQRGLTQKQVANLLGLKCEERLSRWENDRGMPSLKNLFKISDVYEVQAEDLYY